MKKKLALVLAGLMTVMSLAGCGSKQEATTAAPAADGRHRREAGRGRG